MRTFNSLFVKALSIMVIAVIVPFAAFSVVLLERAKDRAVLTIAQDTKDFAELVARQIGGSVKFGNDVALSQIVAGALAAAGSNLDQLVVYNAAGETIFPRGTGNGPPSEVLLQVAETVTDTGESQSENHGLTYGTPITFGSDPAILGAIVLSFQANAELAVARSQVTQQIIGGAIILALVLLGAGLVLVRFVFRPLGELHGTIAEMGRGNLNFHVPFADRKGEIGQFARGLEELRAMLKTSDQLRAETACKSAAFERSSVAMMVIDNDQTVLYANPVCLDLLEHLKEPLRSSWLDLDHERVIGTSLKSLRPLQDILRDVAQNGQAVLPAVETISIGAARIQIRLDPVLAADGHMLGVVLGWNDLTDTHSKMILMNALDQSMMRFEVSSDGAIQDANDHFRQCLSLDEETLAAAGFQSIFLPDVSDNPDPMAQHACSGRFGFAPADGGAPRIVDGSFVAIEDPDGRPEKFLFVGTDVTDAVAADHASRAALERSTSVQQDVAKALGSALTELARGSLNVDIEGPFPDGYERLRLNFNTALGELRAALGAVQQNAESIRSETQEITSAADDLSRRTERQAATLAETASALDELTSSVRSAADGTEEASDVARQAQERAQEGGRVAREAVAAMDGIKTSSREISKITGVIEDIAFQTNLLALNAGVEAARAGEAGLGFAVVASEVRALAQRSSDAAREINTLISSSEEQVQSGVDLVDKTGSALLEIVASVAEISGLVSEIAVSNKQQAAGLDEINAAVNELDQVTQQNAAMFEETTAASHTLMAETGALAKAVSRFELGASKGTAKTGHTQELGPSPKENAARQTRSSRQPQVRAGHNRVSNPAHRGSEAVAVEFEPDTGWEDF